MGVLQCYGDMLRETYSRLGSWGSGQSFFVTSKPDGMNVCVCANTHVHVCGCLVGRRSWGQNERNRWTGQYFRNLKEI